MHSSAPVTITLGGNATVLIRGGGRTVITDPWLGESIGPWRRPRPAALSEADLAAAGAVLISHGHRDHLDPGSLAGISRETPVVTPHGGPLRRLRAAGLQNVHPLAEWEEWSAPGLRVMAVPSVHARWCVGYVIELEDTRIYFAGDSGPLTPFAEIAERCGPLDAALLPVGGSSLARGRLQRHLTPELAARAAALLRPRLAIPIHWGHVPCVPAALDRFRGTAAAFVRSMAGLAPEITVLVPEDGVAVEIPAGSCGGGGLLGALAEEHADGRP